MKNLKTIFLLVVVALFIPKNSQSTENERKKSFSEQSNEALNKLLELDAKILNINQKNQKTMNKTRKERRDFKKKFERKICHALNIRHAISHAIVMSDNFFVLEYKALKEKLNKITAISEKLLENLKYAKTLMKYEDFRFQYSIEVNNITNQAIIDIVDDHPFQLLQKCIDDENEIYTYFMKNQELTLMTLLEIATENNYLRCQYKIKEEDIDLFKKECYKIFTTDELDSLYSELSGAPFYKIYDRMNLHSLVQCFKKPVEAYRDNQSYLIKYEYEHQKNIKLTKNVRDLRLENIKLTKNIKNLKLKNTDIPKVQNYNPIKILITVTLFLTGMVVLAIFKKNTKLKTKKTKT